jgi:hypothetical protein
MNVYSGSAIPAFRRHVTIKMTYSGDYDSYKWQALFLVREGTQIRLAQGNTFSETEFHKIQKWRAVVSE